MNYKDLIRAAEERLAWMEKSYPAKVSAGSLTAWTSSHNIAVQKSLVRLLKRYQKNPQLDLYTELDKMRKG